MKEGDEFIKGFKKGQKKILEDWLFFLEMTIYGNPKEKYCNKSLLKYKRIKIIKLLKKFGK